MYKQSNDDQDFYNEEAELLDLSEDDDPGINEAEEMTYRYKSLSGRQHKRLLKYTRKQRYRMHLQTTKDYIDLCEADKFDVFTEEAKNQIIEHGKETINFINDKLKQIEENEIAIFNKSIKPIHKRLLPLKSK